MAYRFLAVRLDAQHVQPCATALDPYLPHGASVPRVLTMGGDAKLLLLHPRVKAPEDLPADLHSSITERFAGQWVEHSIDIEEPDWRALFIVQFASRSKEVPPLAAKLPSGWRRYLSNFATRQPLQLGGRSYASVEHYFQGRKAECSNRPDMGQWWSREYEGPERVDDDPRAAKRAGSRKGYQAHDAVLQTERWIEVREEVMQTAIEARWAQDELFARILVSTRGLELLHFERSGPRSFWGGSLDKRTGRSRGTNRLGTIMMERRDREP